jgi:transposase
MANKLTRAEKMRRFFEKNPEMTIVQVASEFGVSYQTAYKAKQSMNKAIEKTIKRLEAKDEVSGLTPEQTVEKVFQATQGRVRNAFSEETPVGIDATLAERGTKYGKFIDQAAVTYKLKNVLREHSSNHSKSYSYDQAEALDMICVKLGRIVNGSPDYADSWVDIAGYAKLVADRLQTGKTV